MHDLRQRLKAGLFLMDGAMGTQLQASEIDEQDWDGKHGCNEYLNITRPDVIRSIHSLYLKAGCDAVETNTFGAAPDTLADYGLAERAVEINGAAARCARAAADAASTPEHPRYVFGSIGPGTKLPTLGQTTFESLRAGYVCQMDAMLEGGVDGILFETCQDILQVKAGLCAYEDVTGGSHDLPIYVSITIEDTGTMLIGTSVAAAVAILSPYPIDVLGMNCATGPQGMRRHLQHLNENWTGPIAAMPNAGLPEMVDKEVQYPLGPQEFAEVMQELVGEVNLNVVGGCCGTTAAHLEMLAESLKDFKPAPRDNRPPQQVASSFNPVDLSQDPPPLYIGERANATGSKKFRSCLEEGDYEAAFAILTAQEQNGAHMLDLNCAYAEGVEMKDVEILVARAARECRIPLMIDTTNADVAERALQLYGGRAFINSINFEDGEERAHRVANMARRFGSGLVCLTIDEQGMARTADRKLEIAKRLVAFCETNYAIGRESIFIDPLTFTVASGDASLNDAALETIAAIRSIKEEIPGVRIMLGASNISFGLKPPARKVINALFLDMCVEAGMDAAIVNVAHLAPLNSIDETALELARKLLENDRSDGDPLLSLIEHFEAHDGVEEEVEEESLSDEELAHRDVVRGKVITEELIDSLLEKYTAEDILNDILVPAMAEVGRLFNEGDLQLPFVLKSAEVMKKAVDLLKPHMKHDGAGKSRGKMVIATVAGDVHDIGKDLVDIILSNNGFDVVNLGTKVRVEEMLKAIKEHSADVIGMSGLLVKSTAVMAENVKFLKENGVDIPVFLGGAALTPTFVADQCQSGYEGRCVYCKDAFAGLYYFRDFMATGTLPEHNKVARTEKKEAGARVSGGPVENPHPVPAAPFWGCRMEEGVDLDKIYPLINMRALIRGSWGFRQKKKSEEEYNRLLEEEVYPLFAALREQHTEKGTFKPRYAWGYYKCHGEDNILAIDGPEGQIDLQFPRSEEAPHIALPDYFDREQDVLPVMVVTLGEGYEQECRRLKENHEYQQYLIFYGLAAELTDALADFVHARIRAELGFPDPPDMLPEDYFKSNYRGRRYGFGYSSCPDVMMNKVVCDLVDADKIGVAVTESGMMVPEVTTAAIVTHNEKATY